MRHLQETIRAFLVFLGRIFLSFRSRCIVQVLSCGRLVVVNSLGRACWGFGIVLSLKDCMSSPSRSFANLQGPPFCNLLWLLVFRTVPAGRKLCWIHCWSTWFFWGFTGGKLASSGRYSCYLVSMDLDDFLVRWLRQLHLGMFGFLLQLLWTPWWRFSTPPT